MEYFVKSAGYGTDDDLAQIILKSVCNFDYKKRGQMQSFVISPKKEPVIKPYFSGFRMLASNQEVRLNNSITIQKISEKGHFTQDYFVMQNRRTFSFDYRSKAVGWGFFNDAILFHTLTNGNFNQVANAPASTVADSDKLMKAIKCSGKYMSSELYEQVKALLTPESIGMMAAFGAAYIASQLTPVGWAADALVAVMFIGGVIFMGEELIEVGKLLKKFYETATSASSDAQYEEAGKYFAEAVTKVGVDVIVMILLHKVTKAVDRKIVKIKSNSGGGNGGGNESGGSKKTTEVEKPKENEPKPTVKLKPGDKDPNWKGPVDYTDTYKDGKSVKPGKDFTKSQKDKIYEKNRQENGGNLVSDLDGTILEVPQKSQSGVTPSKYEAQLDHKTPANPKDGGIGGNNSSSNAQVLSREQNRAKSNK